MATILETMLHRLYAGILRGPSIYARPGRQLIDLQDFRHFSGTNPAGAAATLLSEARRVEFPAKARDFEPPQGPEEEWPHEARAASNAHRRQKDLLQRLREIAESARDFQNDHGESALFVGFPLLWLPRAEHSKGPGGRESRVLAPVAFVPVSLEVRRAGRAGATIACLGEGADLLIPNPALGAWIEQQTGQTAEGMFADNEGADPWRELEGIIAWIRNTLDLSDPTFGKLDAAVPLAVLKDVKELPHQPALVNSALLGLFPMANLGLLRDTRWMIENEGALAGPVRVFLEPAAIERAPTVSEKPKEPGETGEVEELETPVPAPPPAKSGRDFTTETLVTHADPCQNAAVRHARASDILVIHGPPGTGKSQTIANVIGDHLGRGERVLFVCDKRTAIDVVKYRLDALGLGHLCGVVHDAARDRTALYLRLRQHLENLAETPPEADPTRELAALNRRLGKLHGELTAAYHALNRDGEELKSFHAMTGEWFELLTAAPPVAGEPAAPVTSDEVHHHLIDLDEVWRRAVRVGWADSPWRDCLSINLTQFLARSTAEWERNLEGIAAAARRADEFLDDEMLALDTINPAQEQAAARRELAVMLERLEPKGLPKFCARMADASGEEIVALGQERDGMLALAAEFETTPLDAELRAAVQDTPPPISELNYRLQAIDAFLPIAASFKRFFAFGAKGAASAALAPLGLAVTPANLEKARGFYRGLRLRLIIGGFLQRCAEDGESRALLDDRVIRSGWGQFAQVLAAAELGRTPALASVLDCLRTTLRDLTRAPNVATNLRVSADRADRLAALEEAVAAAGLFTPEAQAETSAHWRANAPCVPAAEAWSIAFGTLESSVRMTDALHRLPAGLAVHARWHADSATEPELALTAVRRAACENDLRARAGCDESLQSIDTERVEAAFRGLAELSARKQQLVRAHVRRLWQRRQRERLLATTGTRLNGVGSALKQRLVTRGERALKLRQMLATNAKTEDGDPLFDLCPVWMTSPATVAQAFPREPLFDVLIFDEASQCRIEEALPVLLRAKRVVVAGDPKQLPPTRFFESGVADSTETDAETAEELFEQQQSDVEDLLGAALNLNVQEAFLDVHYRSRNEALIGFSNEQFYSSRLQPIPGHPKNKALSAPLRIQRVEGVYENRTNRVEAEKVVELVDELLADEKPPSIGIGCFNLPQRNLIIDLLDRRAEGKAGFASRLAAARERRGRDSFEGLFVKNLENVQGDERDVMIICTTFAPDPKGKFRRGFGALSGAGGGRRLNVLVTRARTGIYLITSIPRSEYAALPAVEPGRIPNGRFFLYAYLRYAEALEAGFEKWQSRLENLPPQALAECHVLPIANPSRVAQALGFALRDRQSLGSIVHWGNDGFCIDAAIVHPEFAADVTIGVLTDFNRFAKTPDPIEWEMFRSLVLAGQGWKLHRVWTPALLRDWQREITGIRTAHDAELARQRETLDETESAPHA